jgi:protein-L-isoaspartate(D-aspartate) O-methyltransferase
MITNSKIARKSMLEGQCFTNNVNDESVLAALKLIPREVFVPSAYAESAYIDEDIKLPGGRVLLQPMVFARMLQLAEINKSQRVLDIASASGYSSAVISKLAKEVIALESDSELTAGASVNFNKLGIENITAVAGDVLLGANEYKYYDLIMIQGMVQYVPENLIKQLKPGAKLVAILEEKEGLGNIVVITKDERSFATTKYFQTLAFKLIEFTKPERFEF